MKGRSLLKLTEALQGTLQEVERRGSYLLRRGDGGKECTHEITPFRSGQDLA